MGLKHVPLVSIVFFLLNILIRITLGGESLSERLRCFGFWLKGSKKMLTYFAVVNGVTSVSGTWKNK
jgi:hypothetical protein